MSASATVSSGRLLHQRPFVLFWLSRLAATIGYQILANLVQHGFNGPVYPINPNADSIHSIAISRSSRKLSGVRNYPPRFNPKPWGFSAESNLF